MIIKNFIILSIGLFTGYVYNNYIQINKQAQVYSSRDLQSDLKKEVDRVNTILDETEKKHIKKNNIPKPKPPAPDIGCKCNGTGELIQPDGNKLKCQCSRDEGICKCKSKEETLLQLTSPQNIQVNP